MPELTRDAEKLLLRMYDSYCRKVKSGSSKKSANYFGSALDIHDAFAPDSDFDDVSDLVDELKRCGYIDSDRGDNMALKVSISSAAIAYLQNLPKKKLLAIANFVSNFIP